MAEIRQYDLVTVKPGAYMGLVEDSVVIKEKTLGCAVEIFGDQEAFEVDIGSSPEDWDCITVQRDDIAIAE